MSWSPLYPLDLSPSGDTTSEALQKLANEVNNIYDLLNFLRNEIVSYKGKFLRIFTPADNEHWFNDAVRLQNDYIVFVGRAKLSGADYRGFLVKCNTDLTLGIQKMVDSVFPHQVAWDGENLFIAGDIKNDDKVYIGKFDANLNPVKQIQIGDIKALYSMCLDGNYIYITGRDVSDKGIIAKLDKELNIISSVAISPDTGGTYAQVNATCITVIQGVLYAIAQRYDMDATPEYRGFILEFDTDLNLLSQCFINTSNDFYLNKLIADENYLYVCGKDSQTSYCFKLNPDLTIAKQVAVKDAVEELNLTDIKYANQTLYLGGNCSQKGGCILSIDPDFNSTPKAVNIPPDNNIYSSFSISNIKVTEEESIIFTTMCYGIFSLAWSRIIGNESLTACNSALQIVENSDVLIEESLFSLADANLTLSTASLTTAIASYDWNRSFLSTCLGKFA